MLYRQGDILLVPVDCVPEGSRSFARENGKIVLAHGEATGHHHAVINEAELYTTDEDPLVSVDEAIDLYLLVHGDSVGLIHQEHAEITLDPGVYKVVRQREYTPERISRVVD